jgi:uncharacterized protein
MPVAPTYPGVYIEEIPSGVRTITGVSTSVTAFVGYTQKGPVDKAVRVFNFSEYERAFGGLSRDSEIGYAVQQFFLNGGAEAWVVRIAVGAAKAAVTLNSVEAGNGKALEVTARSDGVWGNYLRLDVDYNTTNSDSSFNLVVSEYIPRGTELALGRVETFRNLVMDEKSPQYAPKVISASSQIVTAERHADVDATVLSGLPAGWSQSGDLSGLTLPGDLDDTKRFIAIVVDGDGPYEIPIFPAGSPPADLNALVTNLESAIQGINPGLARFSGFSVERVNALGTAAATGNYLRFTSGTPGTAEREQSSGQLLNASSNSASRTLKLGLANGGRERAAAADLRPSQTGTVSEDLADLTSATLSAINSADQIRARVMDGTTVIAEQVFTLGTTVNSLTELAQTMQSRIRAGAPTQPAFSKMTVQVVGTRLRAVAGTDKTDAVLEFTNTGGGTAASTIRINTAATSENVQRYSLGVGQDRAAQVDAVAGNDGLAPTSDTPLRGKLSEKSGIYALEDVDIFNILCIPRMAELAESAAPALIDEAVSYCAARRAFLIVDPPKDVDTVSEMEDWATNKLTPTRNAAIYFPFVTVSDPLDGSRPNPFPPSGTIAGLYARTDSTRGVWKAPAGTEATLNNVRGLAYSLTNMENGVLNKLGVNCLRQFPVYGRVCWGARTLEGADQQASEWKYVPVRRLALFIEESLYRGTQWVVFEPNDEPLWAQIRLNIGAFMHNLFRQGAFQGTTPREAYFVKCDKETTTQADINLGIVNILVGFAPLKPAEFVIIQIQQMAGQIES